MTSKFLLLILNIFHTFSSVSIADFEQVNVSWVKSLMKKELLSGPINASYLGWDKFNDFKPIWSFWLNIARKKF